ncbi:MAG: 30S ribosome-binding factor RbfA [Firmicutes bacterium]|jgi:ribosome-binding factor A|nr:30S ribosome-binding factor RbfA [Bacillota bacterium]
MTGRHTRVGEEIKREVSMIIAQEVKDPRLGMLSITDVEVSRDLSFAKIYFSVLGDEKERELTLAGLNRATGFIRSELAKRIRVRHTPEISFHYDPSLVQGARINALLKDLNPSKEEGGEES